MENTLLLINGTFFEVMISVSVSMRMLEYSKYLKEADHTSIGLSFLFAAILIAYILYILYFTIFVANDVVLKSKSELLSS